MSDNSKQKDAKQIAKNVAKRTEKMNKSKTAKTSTIDQRRTELAEFVGSFPPAIQAQTVALALAQVAPSEFRSKEDAKDAIRLFTSKPFVRHLKKVIEEHGIDGAFDEMENLDLDDMKQVFEFFGEDYQEQD